ncbi:hypothetical protein GOBAR_AA15799 [Gossypium barbadense]|uniref:Uncharacterized protein n=1 Tax=Gossypium barbadense TaxID=3634 RepID=A0A2P5XNG0_GOSBA|nr:hypothetical protein GOBAR_AA15799 [Gossypium barbadense]
MMLMLETESTLISLMTKRMRLMLHKGKMMLLKNKNLLDGQEPKFLLEQIGRNVYEDVKQKLWYSVYAIGVVVVCSAIGYCFYYKKYTCYM